MSHTYPVSRQRQRKLSETISEYINSLGSSQGVNGSQKGEFENINRLESTEGVDGILKAESTFQRNLKKLAKCQSFKEGNKEDNYTTVLHKAIIRFKLEWNEAHERTHKYPRECTKKCAQMCAQESVIRHILAEYPELLHCHRDHSPSYCGQTPLHMAISKENKELVEMLLKAAKKYKPNADSVKERLSKMDISEEIKEMVEKILKTARNEEPNADGVKELLSLIDHDLVEMVLKAAINEKANSDSVKELLSQNATGLRFKNNVMMGQLPLSIAALTDNKDIVKLLLQQEETNVYQQNSNNDNLCHSLLKYVYIFPEKEGTAIEMMKFINEEEKDCCKQLFLMVNEDKETPLILAAKHGQVEIVKYILEEGYCTSDDSSGLFDVKLYDMTEIDHQLKEYRRQEDDNEMKEHLKNSTMKAPPTEKDNGTPSVFDLIFHHSYKTSLKFMQIRPIQWMIVKKWRHYRYFLYSFLLFHIIVMSVLTAAAVERVTSQKTVTINQGLREPFPAYYAIIMTIVSLLYLWVGVFKIVQHCRRKFQLTHKPFFNPYANAIFQALFLLFALCIVSDFGTTWATEYNNMLLIAAVVIGWYLLLFFLRANGFFCFFTSLIQRILLQDMTRFAPIIGLELVAFSTAMFMLLQNPNNQNNVGYSNWWEMLLLTFKSFLGVGDIPISDSSHPVWLAIVFVIFIIMTTILMLNALIAILSSTCTDLLNQFTFDMHLHLQQLAVILFFEGLLPNCVTHHIAKTVTREVEVKRYDRFRKKIRIMKRHLMRIDVLEDEDGIGGATEATILHKLTKVVNDKYTGKDKTPQSTLNNQRKTKSTKSTMSNTVEHLDLEKKHLDIYHHSQVGQTQTI